MPLAVLRIIELSFEVPVFGDTSDTSLDLGAGIIEGMALPGKGGNLGIAGHRDGFFRTLRHIAPEAMEVYRRHFRNPGPSRQPMLSWTRDLPIAGEPADVVAIVDAYAKWLSGSEIPKLFIDAEPAGFLIGAQREFCRAWPNQQTMLVKGSHFLQEEAPQEVGEATARFVSKVLAGQIS